jgi:hypothetical protein
LPFSKLHGERPELAFPRHDGQHGPAYVTPVPQQQLAFFHLLLFVLLHEPPRAPLLRLLAFLLLICFFLLVLRVAQHVVPGRQLVFRPYVLVVLPSLSS